MKFGLFQSLALKKEIKLLNSKGSFIRSHSFHLKFIETNSNKAIFIVKKKIGSSPIRNKIKRRIRSILGNQNSLESKNIHVMVIVKPDILHVSFQQLLSEFRMTFEQIYKKIFS